MGSADHQLGLVTRSATLSQTLGGQGPAVTLASAPHQDGGLVGQARGGPESPGPVAPGRAGREGFAFTDSVSVRGFGGQSSRRWPQGGLSSLAPCAQDVPPVGDLPSVMVMASRGAQTQPGGPDAPHNPTQAWLTVCGPLRATARFPSSAGRRALQVRPSIILSP